MHPGHFGFFQYGIACRGTTKHSIKDSNRFIDHVRLSLGAGLLLPAVSFDALPLSATPIEITPTTGAVAMATVGNITLSLFPSFYSSPLETRRIMEGE